MASLAEISLCTGCDGIGLGLRQAGLPLRTVCYVEREAFAVANLVAKIKEGRLDDAPIWGDLTQFPSEIFAGKVDVIHGGFPCQPFSTAGKRLGTEDERHIFPHIIRIVETIKPLWVFLENVPGIISAKCVGVPNDPDGTPVLLHVLRELERRGYECEWGIFSAAEVGAPHQRKRVFILAKLGNAPIIRQQGLHGEFGGKEEVGRLQESSGASELDHALRDEHSGAKPGGDGIPEGVPCEHRPDDRSSGELGGTRHDGGEELAFPGFEGREGGELHGTPCEREGLSRPACERGGDGFGGDEDTDIRTAWPSHPGEPQHWWEPPRTIVENAGYEGITQKDVGKTDRIRGLEYAGEVRDVEKSDEPRLEEPAILDPNLLVGPSRAEEPRDGEAESPLGGDADGRSDWLDESYGEVTDRASELMLLGNGVVPETAAKAWTTLYRRFLT